MGDLMHALPALSDAKSIFPDIEFDWVVDEAFAEVPFWHPAVKNIYKSAHRRWKKNFWQSLKAGEFTKFYKQLNNNNYDLVIDAQNNVKSSVISLIRNGDVTGMDRRSVAEQPAFLAYKNPLYIDKHQHAIQRQRQLFAQALKYELPESSADYGIKNDAFKTPSEKIDSPYLFFVHNASWTTKLWPDSYWHELIKLAKKNGFNVVLPGGSQDELERAKKIAGQHDNAKSLERMSLSELGGVISGAAGAVCCDTGLAHLTAIIGIPAVTLYGPTSTDLIGTSGQNQIHIEAEIPPFNCSPCYQRTCDYQQRNTAMSACMNSIEPDITWQVLQNKMSLIEEN